MNHTSEKPLVVQMIQKEVRAMADAAARKGQVVISDPDAVVELFDIYPANEWMAMETEHETPQMLFGNFWLQGELCILFADTNMGKSILAVQLADALSRGTAIAPFAAEAPPMPVLYLDLELSAKQFEQRYTDASGRHRFAPEFYRGEFNPYSTLADGGKMFNQSLPLAISRAIKRTGADVLIIDNITCLRSGTDSAAGAISLMRNLQAIKSKYGLSVLVLAHTPKRNPAKPVSRNDLQGSKMLINFADSAFAMGESHTQPSLRYLKQVKQRSLAETYGPTNVCLCRFERSRSFLQLRMCGFDAEHNHLAPNQRRYNSQTIATAAQLQSQGQSQRQIARQLKLGLGTVNKILNTTAGTVNTNKPAATGKPAPKPIARHIPNPGGPIPLNEFF